MSLTVTNPGFEIGKKRGGLLKDLYTLFRDSWTVRRNLAPTMWAKRGT